MNRNDLDLISKLLNQKVDELEKEINRLNEKLSCQDLYRVERINLNLYIRELNKYKKVLNKIDQAKSYLIS